MEIFSKEGDFYDSIATEAESNALEDLLSELDAKLPPAETLVESKNNPPGRKVPCLTQVNQNAVKYFKKLRELEEMQHRPLYGGLEVENTIECIQQMFRLRRGVHRVMDTFAEHLESLQQLHHLCHAFPIPLREDFVRLPVIEGRDTSALTPLRISNAFKRKREEDHEAVRKQSLDNFYELLRPAKSFCLLEWSKMSKEKQEKCRLSPVSQFQTASTRQGLATARFPPNRFL